ncbi:MAG: hypothetical protein NC926_07735 [Candidatus Omnitrophica bacterium]|nr:hypothetical protein [Candidatus Omnitrophota bacterium]
MLEKNTFKIYWSPVLRRSKNADEKKKGEEIGNIFINSEIIERQTVKEV